MIEDDVRYYALLLTATLIWGSTFVISKDIMQHVAPSFLIGMRFVPAALILAGSFVKYRSLYLVPRNIVFGCGCGLVLFIAYYFQMTGLTLTSPGKNAFLTATDCVIVPFLVWLLMRKRPTRYNIVAAICALIGIGCISLSKGISLEPGDIFSLCGAFFFALHIALVGKLARQYNIFVLTIWEFIVVGTCGMLCGILTEPIPDITTFSTIHWLEWLYLAILATTIALLFQNIAQAHILPSTAAIILTSESVFATFISVLLGIDVLTPRLVAGFVLVFLSVLIAEALPTFLNKRRTRA